MQLINLSSFKKLNTQIITKYTNIDLHVVEVVSDERIKDVSFRYYFAAQFYQLFSKKNFN